jgi:hypothetical protein
MCTCCFNIVCYDCTRGPYGTLCGSCETSRLKSDKRISLAHVEDEGVAAVDTVSQGVGEYLGIVADVFNGMVLFFHHP